MKEKNAMKEINARSQSVRQLLGQKYTLDSYQREYKWKKEQVDELVNDLLRAFNDNYEEGHEQSHVEEYGHYFLGPIIVNKTDNHRDIVDGQQRLTTLTLILICLLHMAENNDQKTNLQNLIFAAKFGKKSFNLNVPERTECLNKLYEGQKVDVANESESVRNLVGQYEKIEEGLDEESLAPTKVPLFIDWLIEKVHLVEIVASSDSDAYKIFETMNDRGLRLAPAEMLKGYLLSEIQDSDSRKTADSSWKTMMDKLTLNKGEDSDAIKSWLRARYAEKMQDFDDIGSKFHRWVRENNSALRLNSSRDFKEFITTDFVFYANQYFTLRRAAEQYNPDNGLERVYYLAQHSFTLQYPLLLASLSPSDSSAEISAKLRVVATYLDILVHRRIGQWTSIAESSMRSQIFGLAPQLRNKTVSQVADLLVKEVQNGPKGTFISDFGLHGNNRPRIHRILARVTDYIQTESGLASRYTDYFAPGKKSFQIEHVWHNNYQDVCQEESIDSKELGENAFYTERDNLGGLLLLPSKDNAAYSDKPYAEKREYYAHQNLLAGSLHASCYKANTGFRQFVEKSKLPFVAHENFTLEAMAQRQDLYRKIADQIWSPDRIIEAAK